MAYIVEVTLDSGETSLLNFDYIERVESHGSNMVKAFFARDPAGQACLTLQLTMADACKLLAAKAT